jgi:pyruvate/2-oxoglutarate dehydrogenase complex dihydrolipoamide acyltransferase (E2) component
MITSEGNERITEVRITDDELVVDLTDGRTLSIPLVWYPNLLNASAAERSDWELIGDGVGVHWPQIDEDLSAAGMLRGVQAPATRHHWLPAKEIGAHAVNMPRSYGATIVEAKIKRQQDLTELESLAEQLPDEEAKAHIHNLLNSYSALEDTLGEVIAALTQTIQQAQGARGQAAQGTLVNWGQMVEHAQRALGEMAEEARGAVPLGGGQEELNATEAAKRKAEELGIDLSQIEGSGPGGLITIKDVIGLSRQQG